MKPQLLEPYFSATRGFQLFFGMLNNLPNFYVTQWEKSSAKLTDWSEDG
jgi:hypothetical protein